MEKVLRIVVRSVKNLKKKNHVSFKSYRTCYAFRTVINNVLLQMTRECHVYKNKGKMKILWDLFDCKNFSHGRTRLKTCIRLLIIHAYRIKK